MKNPRVIRRKNKVNINMESQEIESWDSSAFDKVDIKLLKAKFIENYNKHTEFLIQLISSRQSLNTAMINVQEVINDSMNGSMIINEQPTVDAMDEAYDLALKMYAYEQAFSFLSEEDKKDILSGLIQGNRPLTKSTKNNPVAHIPDNFNKKLIAQIEAINEQLKPILGGPTASPYGDPKPREKPTKSPPRNDIDIKSGVGVIKRKFKN